MNTQDFGTRPSTTIRPPSTANLMIDSADRTQGATPWNFQITKKESILNGFFTRIATTEVVLEWCYDNINSSNNALFIDISGEGANTYVNANYQVQITTGVYNVAEVLAQIVYELNTGTGTTGATFTLVPASQNPEGFTKIDCSGAVFNMWPANPALETTLADQLEFIDWTDFPGSGFNSYTYLDCPDIRPYRYLDFVSPDLTYAQYLKDSSTAASPRDVLCRWYFAEDTQEAYDSCGFPILMGYARFCRRRIFNPPKQIRWDSNLPIGGLRFEVYDQDGNLLTWGDQDTNWLMTLQVSEN